MPVVRSLAVGNGGLSIIIPTQDHQVVIGECIRSLILQSAPAEEIIVVDRHSHDQTLTVLDEDYPSVRVVKTRRNANLSKALNIGIRLSSQPLVAVVFPSTKLDKLYFQSLIENMEKPENADVGSATGKILKMFRGSDVIDSSGLIAGEGISPPSKRGEGEKGSETYNRIDTVLGVARGAAVYRRSLLEDVRLFGETFDESLSEVLEDVDLAWRAHLQGWRGLFVPDAEAVFDVRDEKPGPTSPNATRWQYGWRVMVLKNASSRDLIRGLPGAILGGAGSAVKNTRGVISTLLALAGNSCSWTELRCKRQEIQKRASERALEARRKRA